MREFIERHDSREGFTKYMEMVVPQEQHEMLKLKDGLIFAEWLKATVFKSANTMLEIDARGKRNYVYAEIPNNTPLAKKRTIITMLDRYGFMKITHNDMESWLWIPPMLFSPNKRGIYGNSQNNKVQLGSTVVVKRKTQK
jgi:hypothetical protein